MKTFFSDFSNWIARWTGSHWAFLIAFMVVLVGLVILPIDIVSICISIVTLLMLFVLQNTQNRDTAAIHLKLDEVITGLRGPRDEIAGVEAKSHEEIEELRGT